MSTHLDALERVITDVVAPRAAATDEQGAFPRAAVSALGEQPITATEDAPAAQRVRAQLDQHGAVLFTGSFSKVSSIQRISTVGGVAPAEGCSTAAIGKVVRVPYTADYRMFATQ